MNTFKHLFLLSLPNTVPVAAAPAKPFDALKDSQLFDAENSEPLSATGGSCSSSQERPQNSRSADVRAGATSPKRRQNNGSSQRHRARGTESAVLYGVKTGKHQMCGYSYDKIYLEMNLSCMCALGQQQLR